MEDRAQYIRLAGIVRESIVDGPGIRLTVFCQGCPHGCAGCHNGVTHDFAGGYDCSVDKILAAVDENPLLDGVTFSGGEPACQPEGFLTLARGIKARGLDIIMYSGYTFEELCAMAEKNEALSGLLQLVDTLVDGRYEDQKRDLTLAFRGSANQRVIDVKASLAEGRTVASQKF